VFDLDFFKRKPEAFTKLAREFLVQKKQEQQEETDADYSWTSGLTPSHEFVKLLNEHGVLYKYFTVNIDNSESKFLSQEKLVQLYGAVSL
jgi:NAD-dependent SIR2 family protein deacetylase